MGRTAFGGIADVAGLATGSTRSRMTHAEGSFSRKPYYGNKPCPAVQNENADFSSTRSEGAVSSRRIIVSPHSEVGAQNARRHQGARPTRSLIERDRRSRTQPPQYPAGLVGSGGSSNDDIRRARADTKGRADARRRAVRSQAEHPHDHGRRHRLVQCERLQSWRDGLPHAQHRPHRQGRRPVYRLVRRAKLHRGARGLHHRTIADQDRPDQSRSARLGYRTTRRRHECRRSLETARLRHRTIRQEPSRRPQRISADRARLRRILRQSLSSERRGRAAEPGLPQGPEVPGQVRAARRAQMQAPATPTMRPSIPPMGVSASR